LTSPRFCSGDRPLPVSQPYSPLKDSNLPAATRPIFKLHAVKTYDRQRYAEQPCMKELLDNEISNLRELRRCKNIIHLKAVYETDKDIKIVTNYAGDEDLNNYI